MIALKAKALRTVSTLKALKVDEKAKASDISDESSDNEETSIDDEISLISKNLKKLWKRRGRKDKSYKYNGKSKNFSKEKKSKNKIIWFECKRPRCNTLFSIIELITASENQCTIP